MRSIRWGRILIAGVMSEAGVIAVMLAVMTAYWLLTPTMTDAQYNSLGEEVGYYVAPTAGAITTVLSVLWATHRLTSAFILHGILVGAVSVVLTIGFIFGARPEHRVMYMIAFGLRIVGGYVGGMIAQWRFSVRAARSTPINQPV